jgi:hypothetical protein
MTQKNSEDFRKFNKKKMATDLRTQALYRNQSILADKISDRIDRARKHLEYTSAYSSQLENVPGTFILPGLHEMNVYCIFPISYHLTTAAGATKLIADSENWTMPMMMVVYNNVKNIIDFMSYFYPYLKEMKDSIEQYQGEPWYKWAKRSIQKIEEWGSKIESLARNAMNKTEELLGPEKLQQVRENEQIAQQMIKNHRLENGFHLTPTIGVDGLSYLPGFEQQSYQPQTIRPSQYQYPFSSGARNIERDTNQNLLS